MLVSLDVGYEQQAESETGRCGVVAFNDWQSRAPFAEMTVLVEGVKPYVSGRLFERELPCLVAGLDAFVAVHPARSITGVLVDGNVRLTKDGRPGLGMYLFEHLGEAVPVIGVAKTAFAGLDAVEVLRGTSTTS